jgi:hypothetical protein
LRERLKLNDGSYCENSSIESKRGINDPTLCGGTKQKEAGTFITI